MLDTRPASTLVIAGEQGFQPLVSTLSTLIHNEITITRVHAPRYTDVRTGIGNSVDSVDASIGV
jgi:hypothetical protein